MTGKMRTHTPEEWDALVMGKVQTLLDRVGKPMSPITVIMGLEAFSAVLRGSNKLSVVFHPEYIEPSLAAAARLQQRLLGGERLDLIIDQLQVTIDRLNEELDAKGGS